MQKIAIVVLANSEGPEGLGRIVNALTAAKEYREAGDDLKVIFTGAGTRWLAALSSKSHPAHALYAAVKPYVTGACGYCATAFEQKDAVAREGVPLLEDYGTNMSYRALTADGYSVLTF